MLSVAPTSVDLLAEKPVVIPIESSNKGVRDSTIGNELLNSEQPSTGMLVLSEDHVPGSDSTSTKVPNSRGSIGKDWLNSLVLDMESNLSPFLDAAPLSSPITVIARAAQNGYAIVSEQPNLMTVTPGVCYTPESENNLLDPRPFSPDYDDIYRFGNEEYEKRSPTSSEKSNQETGCGLSNGCARDTFENLNIPLSEDFFDEPCSPSEKKRRLSMAQHEFETHNASQSLPAKKSNFTESNAQIYDSQSTEVPQFDQSSGMIRKNVEILLANDMESDSCQNSDLATFGATFTLSDSQMELEKTNANYETDCMSTTVTAQPAPFTQEENVAPGPETPTQSERFPSFETADKDQSSQMELYMESNSPSNRNAAPPISVTTDTLSTAQTLENVAGVAEVKQYAPVAQNGNTEFGESLIDLIVTVKPDKMFSQCGLKTPPRSSINPDEEPNEAASPVNNAAGNSINGPSHAGQPLSEERCLSPDQLELTPCIASQKVPLEMPNISENLVQVENTLNDVAKNSFTGPNNEASKSMNTTISTSPNLSTEGQKPAPISPNENDTAVLRGSTHDASNKSVSETSEEHQDTDALSAEVSETGESIETNCKNRSDPLVSEKASNSSSNQKTARSDVNTVTSAGTSSTHKKDKKRVMEIEQQNRLFLSALEGMDDTYVGLTVSSPLSSPLSELRNDPSYVVADLDANSNPTSENVLVESDPSCHGTKQPGQIDRAHQIECPSEGDFHESNVLNIAWESAEEPVQATSSEPTDAQTENYTSNANLPRKALQIPGRIYVAPKRRATKAQRKRDGRLGLCPFGSRLVPSEPFNICWISPLFVPDSTQLITVNQFDWRYPRNYEGIPSFFNECWPISKPINNGMPDNTVGTNKNPMKCTVEVPPPLEPDNRTGRYPPVLLNGIPWKTCDWSYVPYPNVLMLAINSPDLQFQNLHKDNLTRLRMWLEWYPMYRPTKDNGFSNELEEQTFTLLDGRYQLYSKALIIGSRSSNEVDHRLLKEIYDLDAKCQEALKGLLPAQIYINVRGYF